MRHRSTIYARATQICALSAILVASIANLGPHSSAASAEPRIVPKAAKPVAPAPAASAPATAKRKSTPIAKAARAKTKAGTSALPKGFVRLADVAPSIVQDIRLATPNTPLGRPLPGYGAPTCLLVKPVALALKRIQDQLRMRALSLKIYDCYRPVRAQRALVAWASRRRLNKKAAAAKAVSAPGRAAPTGKRFHPKLSRRQILSLRLIRRDSTHSKGIGVAVTLVRLSKDGVGGAPARLDHVAGNGPCDPLNARDLKTGAVDMGTDFLCFDKRSAIWAKGLTNLERAWRGILLEAMELNGFVNDRRRWWHYTYVGKDAPNTPKALDVAVSQ